MVVVDDAVFEKMVQDGIDAIPEEFAQKLDNVAITWDYVPSPWQRIKARLQRGWLLFGLYEGIPKTQRGSNYSLVLPDKITIFKRSLEYVAEDESDLARRVRQTVWHEVAHHFGLSDAEIHRREQRAPPHDTESPS